MKGVLAIPESAGGQAQVRGRIRSLSMVVAVVVLVSSGPAELLQCGTAGSGVHGPLYSAGIGSWRREELW